MAKQAGERCANCGGDIGSGGVDRAVVVTYLAEGGDVVNLRLCNETCGPKVIQPRRFAAVPDLPKVAR